MIKRATEFAPAERASHDEVQRQHEKLASLPFIVGFLDAAPAMTVILNEHRQIVFANRSFADFLGIERIDALRGSRFYVANVVPESGVIGLRLGEAAGCIRAPLAENGCGTSAFCQTCGAANAIVNSQRTNVPDVQECRMIQGEEGVRETALDLRVWANPMEVQGEVFTVFSMLDISAEKRRETLERIFFHDVLNTAGGVKGLADLMVQGVVSANEFTKVAGMLADSTDQLLEEISAQRMMWSAENGELRVSSHVTSSFEMLAAVQHQFHGDRLTRGKSIVLDAAAQAFTFATDTVLLRRVLTNLVKNALEAEHAGATVTLGAHADGDAVCLTVHNPTVMPMPVQRQLFMRSFSTKGTGRGLGTYSIRLISEKYLRGRVSFASTEDEGTTFTVRYPTSI